MIGRGSDTCRTSRGARAGTFQERHVSHVPGAGARGAQLWPHRVVGVPLAVKPHDKILDPRLAWLLASTSRPFFAARGLRLRRRAPYDFATCEPAAPSIPDRSAPSLCKVRPSAACRTTESRSRSACISVGVSPNRLSPPRAGSGHCLMGGNRTFPKQERTGNGAANLLP